MRFLRFRSSSIFVLSLLFIYSFLQISCESKPPASAQKSEVLPKNEWASSMQSLKSALTDLMPIIMDPSKFSEEANQVRIEKEVKSLVKASKDISHSQMLQQKDPTLRFISTAFSEDLSRAEESLMSGKKEYARYVLMNVTAYCMECHTRTSMGPSFQTPEIEKALVGLRRLDRGEYLVATRQFDRALAEFEAVIKQELGPEMNLFDLDRAVRYSLAISIKYLKDPQRSLELTELITKSSQAPFYLKQSALSWQKAVKEWSSEKPVRLNSPQDLLKRTRQLVEKGRVQQNGRGDRSGDVYFLRALSDLHLLLMGSPQASILGEALYLTGLSYDSVRDLSVWSLHENYYESCIRQAPQTKWSGMCYRRLEESVLAGFTGSSGVRVPMDMQVRLRELKKLALP